MTLNVGSNCIQALIHVSSSRLPLPDPEMDSRTVSQSMPFVTYVTFPTNDYSCTFYPLIKH